MKRIHLSLLLIITSVNLIITVTHSYLSKTVTTNPVSITMGIWETQSASITLNNTKTQATVKVTGITPFKQLTYTLKYDTDTVTNEVTGGSNISNQDTFSKNITLGTCSTGGVCVYDIDPHDFKLEVTLTDMNDKLSTISASL